MTKPSISFPKKFLWGASTSAHQIEGGNHNQWSQWELDNAKALAAQAEYHFADLESWPLIAARAKKPSNYVSDRAVDHFHRFESDFDLARSLNLNALRFSLEWSRIEPEEGVWSVEAIEHYRRYFAALQARGITPVVTLFHRTLPTWFADMGGFAKRANVQYYVRFVEKVLDEFGKDMKWIITIHEPEMYAGMSYLYGVWPPQVQHKWQMWRVVENMISAHNKAAKLIHKRGRRYKVSMAYNISHMYPGDDARLTQWSASLMDWVRNHYILSRTARSNDFIGLNYFMSDRVYGYRVHNPDHHHSDLGWDMQPYDLRYVLEMLSERYQKPILITENGVADMADESRQWWLTQTIRAMHTARIHGVDLLGYLHYSLLDGFEWDRGFWPRFGLIEVDNGTLERTVRPSAKAFARMIDKLQDKA